MAEPYDHNVARAAAANGMTLSAWIAHCNRIEAAEKRRRTAERFMREVPTCRDAA